MFAALAISTTITRLTRTTTHKILWLTNTHHKTTCNRARADDISR